MSSSGDVVRAKDLVPSAFQSTGDDAEDELEYDLGNLLAMDARPVDIEAMEEEGVEEHLKRVSTENVQMLVKRLFSLPAKRTEDGPMVTLPSSRTKLPRTMRVPEPKPLTRWEKFALEKGIKKTKRDRMVWDEDKEEFLPRWGYKRANDKSGTDDWLIPVKEGVDDPYSDPFEKLKLEKKDRIIKNQLNQMQNKIRSNGGGSGSKEAELPAGIPQQLLHTDGKTDQPTRADSKRKRPRLEDRPKEDKSTKVARLKAAQRSTASLGKFDKKLAGEPKRPVDPADKKRFAVEKQDSDKQLKILRRVLHGSGEGENAGKSHDPEDSGATNRGGRGGKKRRSAKSKPEATKKGRAGAAKGGKKGGKKK